MIETGQRGRNMAIGTKLVAGNWKMNGLRRDGGRLAQALGARATAAGAALDCELLVCPPATLLSTVGGILAGSGVALGGQDCHPAPKGAYTGTVTAEMRADLGCSHGIPGHSDRRQAPREPHSVV